MSYTPTISVADIEATGSKSATTFLRGDASWAVPSGGTPYTGTIAKVMTADQSINSSTTLTNVTDLVFAIGASETWVYRFSINAGDALAVTGAKVAATIPAGAAMTLATWPIIDANTTIAPVVRSTASGVAADLTTGVMGGDAVNPQIIIHLTVVNGSTAGNVQLQFAQSTSDVTNLTFKKGSFGVGTRCS